MTGSRLSVRGGGKQLPEHGLAVLAAIPFPDPFVQVGVEPALGNRVVGAAHVRFEVAEEAFDGLRMHVTRDVEALLVADAAVGGVALADGVVSAPFVREDGTACVSRTFYQRYQCPFRPILHTGHQTLPHASGNPSDDPLMFERS